MANINTFLYQDHFKDEQTLLSFNYTDPEYNENEHAHEFAELVIVDKGCGVQIFNGEPYFIQEGDVFLVKELDRHFYNELGTLKLMNLHINSKYQFQYLKHIEPILAQLHITDGNFIWLMPQEKDYCMKLIRQLPEIYAKNDSMLLFQVESLFMQLIGVLLTNKNILKNNHTQYKIRNLLIYLQQNYMEQINWHDLSERFFIKNKTLTRKIKELTQMSPVNYLNRLRLLAAREKIYHTDLSITDIATLCGFNNSDYFTKCYKKNFGISPSQARKNHTG
ncbi:helix-turn-helix domain-containing protein [Conservatibacter flavescens]|uniref:AraC family transcriptional regulator n=1 Tax=Conservatibacter flavescens TaxID=28161 RepID=A0A2M8S4Q6_9PAST|nr:helix-turn-helix domain-containing protein [Conservatibacter flavescens]PJG86129.1 AraC family transcriptional regulator [Conservatibacter flavescens]